MANLTYQELEKLYPNKEIKLIPKENENKYNSFGFKTVSEFSQSSFGKIKSYCFMI